MRLFWVLQCSSLPLLGNLNLSSGSYIIMGQTLTVPISLEASTTEQLKKNKRRKCRFNAPWWHMTHSAVATPF